MKKILAVLLSLMLLGAVACADYDNDIQFAEFTFGSTFTEVRQLIPPTT